MLQSKYRKFQELDNKVKSLCRQNSNLRDLSREYAEEIASIKNEFSPELEQGKALKLDLDDIYNMYFTSLLGCAKEFEYSATVLNLEKPPKNRKRVWKSVDQFLNSTDQLYGVRSKCREYAQVMRAKCEEDILKYCQAEYNAAYEKAYKDKVKENKKLLKQIQKGE